MDKARLQDALRDAEELASEVSERFQSAAFYVAASELLRESERAQEGPPARIGNLSLGALPDTVTELVALLDGRSHTDRFEALAYFALHRDGIAAIGTDYIVEAYSKGRTPKPANVADVVAKCVRRGHLMDGERRDGQKTWTLTTTGEKHIAALLSEVGGE